MKKEFFRKLEALARRPDSPREFILCDAKGFGGEAGAGEVPPPISSAEWSAAGGAYRSPEDLYDRARELVEQQALDLMLLSDAAYNRLAGQDHVFDLSAVTPGRRAPGPLTPADVELRAAASFPQPAVYPPPGEQSACYPGAPAADPAHQAVLLYVLALRNDRESDRAALDAYDNFRRAAAARRIPHVLELHASAGPGGQPPQKTRHVLNDDFLRLLLEGPPALRPLLIKTPYYGPRLMEGVAETLPGTPVGVVGAELPTSLDAFDLIADSRRHGARSALLGRRIARAEHQPAFVRMLRLVADGEVAPLEAVHAYHGILQGLGVRPFRPLDEDAQPGARLFAGEDLSCASIIVPADLESDRASFGGKPEPPAQHRAGESGKTSDNAYIPLSKRADDAEPDFDKMTLQEKLEYNQRRRDQIFG